MGSRALLLQHHKAPITTKLLELPYLAQGSFICTGTQANVKEVFSPSAFLPHNKDDKKWEGLFAALSSPRLERNAAREALKNESLYHTLSSLLKDEYSARCHLVDLISATTASEAIALTNEVRTSLVAITKHLTRPLLEAHYRWFKAKIACRKAALHSMDCDHCWTQSILYSNIWSEVQFDTAELDTLQFLCKSTNCPLSAILGTQRKRPFGPIT